MLARTRRHGRRRRRHRARRNHRRAGQDMPRDDPDERRVPVPAELHGLPQVTLHVGERGGVPRDPRRPAVGRWRHRQPGHNRVPQRVPRRFKRDVFCRDRDVRPGAR